MKVSRIIAFLRFFGLHRFWYWYSSIGVNLQINREDADGIFYAVDKNGKVTLVPFLAHNPNMLINPDLDVLESLFSQCKIFGYDPISVHIRSGKGRFDIYYLNNYYPCQSASV